MGWFDDFKKGFECGHADKTERESRTTERLYEERKRELEYKHAFESLNSECDSVLFSKLRSAFTSDAERVYIEEILVSRGYRKTNAGFFDKS